MSAMSVEDLGVTWSQLRFVGEGNEHVVFAIEGTRSVVRFRKLDPGETTEKEMFLRRAECDVYFMKSIMRPLAGSLLVDDACVVGMDVHELGTLMQSITPLREAKRLVKPVNPFAIGIRTPDVASQFIARCSQPLLQTRPNIFKLSLEGELAVIQSAMFPYYEVKKDARKQETDCPPKHSSSLSTESNDGEMVCIELKPKQGFLEAAKGNGQGDRTLLCRFCLKQYLKLETKTETKHSRYCPADLFSGSPDRMISAVECLFDSPQNNLKIFRDGERIKDLSSFKRLSELIVQILTLDTRLSPLERQNIKKSELINSSVEFFNTSQRVEGLTIFPQRSLLSLHSFLGRILYLQMLGGVYEIDAADLYTDMKELLPDEFQDRLTQFEFLNSGSDNLTSSLVDESTKCGDVKERFRDRLSNLDIAAKYQLLQQCQITMTAKDASLMMIIKGPIRNKPPDDVLNKGGISPIWIEWPHQSGCWYETQATLVDIAIKDLSKTIKHSQDLAEFKDVLDKLQKEEKPKCCNA